MKDFIKIITLSQTRILFHHRTRNTKSAGNYKGWGKYQKEGAMHKFCFKYNSSSHVMRCEAFPHIRGP